MSENSPSNRVLIVSGIRPSKYGDSTRPFYLGKYLNNIGFSITHLCKRGGDLEGIECIPFNRDPDVSDFRQLWKLCSSAMNVINERRPEFIYAHQLINGLIITLLLKLNRINYRPTFIYDAHSSDLMEYQKLGPKKFLKGSLLALIEKLVFKKANLCITVSKETKSYCLKKYNIDEAKLKVVKNATDPSVLFDKIKNQELCKRYAVADYAQVAVFVNPRDGFPSNDLAEEYLFNLVEANKTAVKDTLFLIVGGGPQRLTETKNIIYTGFVEDYNEHLNLADFFIAPYPENAVCGGTRNKICDYLMYKKPLISSLEGVRGFDDLTPGEDFHLYKSVSEFIALIKRGKLLGFSQKNWSKSYNWENRARELKVLLDGLLKDE